MSKKGDQPNLFEKVLGKDGVKIARDFQKSTGDKLGKFEKGVKNADRRASIAFKRARRKLPKDLKEAEDMAAKAVLKGEELYEAADIENRLYAAGAGAKLGATLGVRAGPHGAVVGAKIGAVIGFAFGNKSIQKYIDWKNGKKDEFSNDNDTPDSAAAPTPSTAKDAPVEPTPDKPKPPAGPGAP